MRKPGKIRIRLAELLAEYGFRTDPEDLHIVHDQHNNAHRWEGFGDNERGTRIQFYSHYTMAELVQKGVVVERSYVPDRRHSMGSLYNTTMRPIWYEVSPY